MAHAPTVGPAGVAALAPSARASSGTASDRISAKRRAFVLMLLPPRSARARVPGLRPRTRSRAGPHDEVHPPVERPGQLFVAGIERPLLAIRDGIDAVRRHAEGGQVVLRGLGPPLAEGQVVLGGAPLVGVPLDEDAEAGVGLERLGQVLQGPLGLL